MADNLERLDRNERRNSLAAFLRAIKFRKPRKQNTEMESAFAQPGPRTRQEASGSEDYCLIRSAN